MLGPPMPSFPPSHHSLGLTRHQAQQRQRRDINARRGSARDRVIRGMGCCFAAIRSSSPQLLLPSCSARFTSSCVPPATSRRRFRRANRSHIMMGPMHDMMQSVHEILAARRIQVRQRAVVPRLSLTKFLAWLHHQRGPVFISKRCHLAEAARRLQIGSRIPQGQGRARTVAPSPPGLAI